MSGSSLKPLLSASIFKDILYLVKPGQISFNFLPDHIFLTELEEEIT